MEFSNGDSFKLSAEFLRIHSPAADGRLRSIRGEKVNRISSHNKGFGIIKYTIIKSLKGWFDQVISGRRHVGIMSAERVGNYGVR